jgi:hypothetical protein
MEHGDERTRNLEAVFMKMRSLVCSTYDLLEELTVSPSPGERLVAVAALQVKPDARWIDFLGERVTTEKPFVGYQAALALLVAVRTLDVEHHLKLLPAITQGLEALRVISGHTDRARVLKAALRELPKDRKIRG